MGTTAVRTVFVNLYKENGDYTLKLSFYKYALNKYYISLSSLAKRQNLLS